MHEALQQLLAYIRSCLAAGQDEATIRQTLYDNQWGPRWIDQAFHELHAAAHPPAWQPPEPPATAQPHFEEPTLRNVYTSLVNAIKMNVRLVIAAFVTSGLVALLINTLLDKLTTSALDAAFRATSFGTLALILLTLVGLLNVVVAIISSSLVVAATALAIEPSGEQTPQAIVTQTLRSFLPVTGAWLGFSLILYLPIIIVDFVGLAFFSYSVGVVQSQPLILICLFIFMIAWTVVILLRFILVGFVKIYEPQTGYLEAFRRSSSLLRSRGGQIFVVKVGAVATVLYILGRIILRPRAGIFGLGTHNIVKFNIFVIIIGIGVVGGLLMLYHRLRNNEHAHQR
ncbi:MAG: hypothetical protein JWN38_860 [Candidatus Saccharibacteria bacterium]|nr:hypothetical protein [Candidatus Saccharibacteria bacterium]